MFHIAPELLTPEEVQKIRSFAESHDFTDGKTTNEEYSLKKNLQANMSDPAAQQASAIVQNAIVRNQWVRDFCIPKALAAPLVTKYLPGMAYGEHVDTHLVAGNPAVRVDVSCTVFINDPADYDGGELVIRMGDKELKVKEKPGGAVFYPSTHLHRVAPVTRGERLTAITFIESHIRDLQRREILFMLQDFLHENGAGLANDAQMQLEYVRTNLLRMWQDD